MTTDAGSLQHRYIETALCWDLLKYIYLNMLKHVFGCFWTRALFHFNPLIIGFLRECLLMCFLVLFWPLCASWDQRNAVATFSLLNVPCMCQVEQLRRGILIIRCRVFAPPKFHICLSHRKSQWLMLPLADQFSPFCLWLRYESCWTCFLG